MLAGRLGSSVGTSGENPQQGGTKHPFPRPDLSPLIGETQLQTLRPEPAPDFRFSNSPIK